MRPATPSPVPGPSTARPAWGSAFAAADLLDMMVAQRHDGERLRLEIVEHHHVHQADGRRHAFRLDDPRTVGERDLVADDRAGDRKQRRARLDAEPFQDGGADRVVDGREVGGMYDLRLAGRRAGVLDHREARIGAADVADQDRKLERLGLPLVAVMLSSVMPCVVPSTALGRSPCAPQ